MQRWESDLEFESHTLTEVKAFTDENDAITHYELHTGDAGLTIDNPGWEPRVGQAVRYYGGLGRPVRGVVIDGREAYYRTPEEEAERHRKWVEEKNEKDKAEFEARRTELDAQYESLPKEFKARIDKFRNTNPDFRWRFEQYEMMCCLDAVKIAEWAKTTLEPSQSMVTFQSMSYEKQSELVALTDGHSGNSFGFACRLAYWYVTKPEVVVLEHGALTPLVGCEEYGCPHANYPEAGGNDANIVK